MRPQVLASIAALVACTPVPGVSRSAALEFVPAAESVLQIIRETPGVDSVVWVDRERSSADVVYTLQYEGRSGVSGVLQIVKLPNLHLEHYVVGIAAPVAQERVDVTLPVMRAIEARLARLGVVGLSDRIRQECIDVKCE